MEYYRAGYEEDKLDKARKNLLINFFYQCGNDNIWVFK